MFGELSHEDLWALALSTFAGLSTSVGGVLAIIKRPDEHLLAFLLGIAIGVMASLSVLEMYLHNAIEHGFISVTVAMLIGAFAFYFANPYFPEFDAASFNEELLISESSSTHDSKKELRKEDAEIGESTQRAAEGSAGAFAKSAVQRAAGLKRQMSSEPLSPTLAVTTTEGAAAGKLQIGNIPPSELMRLGMLMAVTMTIHNCPEGFAVAFAANTQLGVTLAAAIAIHNIPEGIIVAAPVYAATGNRWLAVGVATVSGLSEPAGALVALLFIRPFLNELFLNLMIGFVGGVMLAVCVCELWPEARKCQSDWKLGQGCALGAVIMLWTLHMGV